MQSQTRTYGDLQVQTLVTAPPYYENCYLITHVPSQKMLLVDPGASGADIAAVVRHNGGALVAILLTHGHPDHVGAVDELARAFAVPVWAHENERVVLDAADQWAQALLGRGMSLPEISYFTDAPTLDFPAALTVIATPGHTPGGVCYRFAGFVLTGDTLFNHGVGRTDFPGGDARQLADSISRLLATADATDECYSGHGPLWTVAPARSWWSEQGMEMVG